MKTIDLNKMASLQALLVSGIDENDTIIKAHIEALKDCVIELCAQMDYAEGTAKEVLYKAVRSMSSLYESLNDVKTELDLAYGAHEQ